MQDAEDFRFTTHTLLLALDASTVDIMKLVLMSAMGGRDWKAAVIVHQESFAALHSHLARPEARY